jgi:nitrile hydratase accessory protein
MFTRFEEFAATQMLGQSDSPPRRHGKLHFDRKWQRTLFGMALAMAKEGHFEWEDFRQQLIRSIGDWEQQTCGAQPTWDYYERFLEALTRAVELHGLVTGAELQAALGTLETTATPRPVAVSQSSKD